MSELERFSTVLYGLLWFLTISYVCFFPYGFLIKICIRKVENTKIQEFSELVTNEIDIKKLEEERVCSNRFILTLRKLLKPDRV